MHVYACEMLVFCRACMHACSCVYPFEFARVGGCAYSCACMSVHAYVYFRVYMYMYVHVYVYACVRIRVYIRIHVCIRVCMRVRICVYLHINFQEGTTKFFAKPQYFEGITHIYVAERRP